MRSIPTLMITGLLVLLWPRPARVTDIRETGTTLDPEDV